jgi:hypothetical protein
MEWNGIEEKRREEKRRDENRREEKIIYLYSTDPTWI